MAANQDLIKLLSRFEPYAAHTLYLADASGKRVPFIMNEAQRMLHARLEQQAKDTGMVRAIVLKARKMGVSTYLAGRYYWKVTTNFGKHALIVGHEQKSTDALYEMVRYFSRHSPLKPSLGYSNAKELIFDKLEGGYRTATAGTENVGRGTTSQYGHLSEFAFWKNGEQQMAGLGTSIAELPGTEIVIESTANGQSGAFFSMWEAAESGQSDWLPVFLPWFIMPQYRRPVKPDFELSPDDVLYQRTYGLDLEQMAFRASKIATYGQGMEHLWLQEFPACSQEAFVIPQGNSLINPTWVIRATKSRFRDENAPLVIGCDPAGDGANDPDRTAIVFRRGRMIFRVEYCQGLDTMQIAGKLAEYNREFQPDGLFIDRGGLGAGVVDRLKELNIPCVGVMSASKANDSETFENLRAEMAWKLRDWLEEEPCRIPNNPAFISDLCAPQPKVSSNGRKLLEKKEDMKRRQIRSPDGFDAAALTFAFPVSHRYAPSAQRDHYKAASSAGY